MSDGSSCGVKCLSESKRVSAGETQVGSWRCSVCVSCIFFHYDHLAPLSGRDRQVGHGAVGSGHRCYFVFGIKKKGEGDKKLEGWFID